MYLYDFKIDRHDVSSTSTYGPGRGPDTLIPRAGLAARTDAPPGHYQTAATHMHSSPLGYWEP